MGGPKRQHFIPRSYLRNFAKVEGDKHFVEVMFKDSGKIRYPMNTKEICVSKNLYTLPHTDSDDKYALEKYYAEHVDSVYPEVYRLLTDTSITRITEEQRTKILSTCLSLYFRTPRFLDADNEELDRIIERMKTFGAPPTAELFFTFKGRNFRFKRDQIDEVYAQAKELNKVDFIVNHLEQWRAFTDNKEKAGFMVIKVGEEVPIITSDNPVDIYGPSWVPFNVFNPLNVIHVPLDRRHYLWISPENNEGDPLQIVRSPRDKLYALTLNSTTVQNAMDWLIGEEGTLSVHRDELTRHNEPTPENEALFADAKLVALKMHELMQFIEANGPGSEASRRKFEEYRQIPALLKDPGFQHLAALADELYK